VADCGSLENCCARKGTVGSNPTPSASNRSVWPAGASEPNGKHLISLVRSSDQVFKCVLDLTGRKALFASQEFLALQKQLQKVSWSIEAIVAKSLEHPASNKD
jgi:hypothetical protein